MPAKGDINVSLSALIGVVLMLFIIIPLGFFINNLMKDHPDVRAPIFYDKFIAYYQDCISQETTDCYCDELDFSLLPRTEFIQLRQLADNTVSIELWKKNGEKSLKTTEISGKQLCTAYFTFWNNFEKKPVSSHVISLDERQTPSTSSINYYLTLYHDQTFACFINYNEASPIGGEPPTFRYKNSGSDAILFQNRDKIIHKYREFCKDKKIQQPKPPQPLNDIFQP
ncbi:MAG: hypothetical protein AABW64_01755 [Nanoarchaeota archaeon]